MTKDKTPLSLVLDLMIGLFKIIILLLETFKKYLPKVRESLKEDKVVSYIIKAIVFGVAAKQTANIITYIIQYGYDNINFMIFYILGLLFLSYFYEIFNGKSTAVSFFVGVITSLFISF